MNGYSECGISTGHCLTNSSHSHPRGKSHSHPRGKSHSAYSDPSSHLTLPPFSTSNAAMVPLHSNFFFLKKQTSKNKTVLASILFIKQSKCSVVNKKENKLRKAKQQTSFNAPHFLPSDATSFTGLPNFLKRQLYIQPSKADNHFFPILLLLISWMNIVKSKTSFSVLTFCNQYGALGTLIVLFSSSRTVFPLRL